MHANIVPPIGPKSVRPKSIATVLLILTVALSIMNQSEVNERGETHFVENDEV